MCARDIFYVLPSCAINQKSIESGGCSWFIGTEEEEEEEEEDSLLLLLLYFSVI